MKHWYVYILASQRNGTLYVGVTNDLARRGDEHKAKATKSFTQKHSVNTLVYFEAYDSPEEAISREKNLKAWQRAWKIRLIEEVNPGWKDLSKELLL
ncbi:MAG TPA: GIY-YIG nuclease family protein [Candidatus Saccharimonadales bacterium]|nr:GIY-YIG nuclease family protein [Candidatus Saccharimonadales bacterium]